jgi:hypothetical protein
MVIRLLERLPSLRLRRATHLIAVGSQYSISSQPSSSVCPLTIFDVCARAGRPTTPNFDVIYAMSYLALTSVIEAHMGSCSTSGSAHFQGQ